MSAQDYYRGLAPYYDIFIEWDRRLGLEIPFIIESAGSAAAGLRVLDLGCGSGQHLKALRAAGFEVEGAEPSPELREQARKNLEGNPIHSLPLEKLNELAASRGPWNLITCLGNTLAHLPPSGLPYFFQSLESALERGGTAVLHLLNYEKIMSGRPANLPVKIVKRGDSAYRFERLYRYLEDSIEFTIRVLKDDQLLAVDRELLYPLTREMLLESALRAGLGSILFFGIFDRQATLTAESDNLVTVIKKGA